MNLSLSPISLISSFPPSIREMIKFATVGSLGMLTNLTCFTMMVIWTDVFLFEFDVMRAYEFLIDPRKMEMWLGASCSFTFAATQNYILNEFWTFNKRPTRGLNHFRYLKFIGFSLMALGVNLFMLTISLEWLEIYWFPGGLPEGYWQLIPQLIGIFFGMFINFLSSKWIIFRKSKKSELF